MRKNEKSILSFSHFTNIWYPIFRKPTIPCLRILLMLRRCSYRNTIRYGDLKAFRVCADKAYDQEKWYDRSRRAKLVTERIKAKEDFLHSTWQEENELFIQLQRSLEISLRL